MNNDKNRKKQIDWLHVIPIGFAMVCITMSIGKLWQSGNPVSLLDVIDIVNMNIFATYISMVISMAYSYFSVRDIKEQEKSGLARKNIAVTIISSIFYGVVAVVNATRYGMVTSIFLLVTSIAYVILFYKVMRVQNRL